MAAGNAFVNGFMGGMGAMTNMIDAKARREHYAWQKEMTLQDREFAAQEREYVNQERERVGRVRELTGTMHVWQNMKPDAKKAVEKAWINQMNQNPAIASALDNNNPNERAQLAGLSWAKDKNGEMMAIPVLDIYDANDPTKKLRSGPMSQRRQDGGPVLGMPMNDFYDFATSQAGVDPLLAAQAEILKQGGTLPEAKETFGDKYVYEGSIFQDSSTGESHRKGYAGGGKNGGKSGSGSGSGGGSWTKGKVIQKTDPTTNEPYDVQLYHQRQDDGSVRVQGMIHDAKGNTKIEDYGVKHFDQKGNIIEYGGLDAMGLNPNPKPAPGAVVDPNAKPVAAGAEAAKFNPDFRFYDPEATTVVDPNARPVETDNPIPAVPVAEQAAKPQSGQKGHLSGFVDSPPTRMTQEKIKAIHDKFALEGPSWANVKGVAGALGNRIKTGFWDDLNRMGNQGTYASRNPGQTMDDNKALMAVYQQFIDQNGREPTGEEFKTFLGQLAGAK